MVPRIIVHNCISLDGSIKDFDADLGKYYEVASRYKPSAHLVGSATIKTGFDSFMENIPKERKQDFCKPKGKDGKPYWVIPDSRGSLKGMLHALRRFEHCRDVIVMVSSSTPYDYIKYLEERDYNLIVAGDDHVDYKKALGILYKKHGIRTILTDTGGTLSSILLENGLADELSIIVCPSIIGKCSTPIFGKLNKKVNLKLNASELLGKDMVLLRYKILK
jgi:2,5-diamino-6-(ribosylamino)-4(3H)-pyrimidinone 5'-phosphate reductase